MTKLAEYRKLLVTLIPAGVILWNTLRPDGSPEVTGDQVDQWVNAVMVVLMPILVYAVPNSPGVPKR